MGISFTRQQTKEHLDALIEAKGAGGVFHATGGEHMNSNDYFKSRTLIKTCKQITDMEKMKKKN